MASSAELRALKARYVKLLGDVGSVMSHLGVCQTLANVCDEKLPLGHTINEVAPDEGKIKKISNSVGEMSGKLSGSVIPGLNAKIRELDIAIAAAEAAEAAARAAAEAARKAAESGGTTAVAKQVIYDRV